MRKAWKRIPGYEGIYSVSDTGCIKSHARQVSLGASGYTRQTKTRILKPSSNSSGYHFVCLYKNGSKKFKMIHQLVALVFIGPCPDRCQINHKDGDKTNNTPGNLEYMTPGENTRHSINQLGNYRHGENQWKHKVTERDVATIRKLYSTGKYTQQQLADKYGIHRGQIAKICNRTSWRHVP